MVDQVISHYRIVDKLGGGGMGVVYKAEDTRLHRLVALKLLSENIARDPVALTRFHFEAQAASALNHPNICTIYDLGEQDGRAFIAMEFLEGQTLRERLRQGPFQHEEIIQLAAQIADALEAAHAKQIIHRDIKPENIFLTTQGQIKLLDFGLAKISPHATQLDRTLSPDSNTLYGFPSNPGAVVGTISYMSPEQARGEELDHRSDLFSLGVVLYEMATGLPAFPGNTPALVYDCILHHSPSPPTQINKALSAATERVILRALEKNAVARYQSAKELRADLLQQNLPVRGTNHTPLHRATSVFEHLRPRLTHEERGLLKQRHTEAPEAHRLYLKGLYHWNKRTVEGIWKGIDYLRQAIDTDPAFALAYAALADCYMPLWYATVLPAAEAVPEATALANRALEMDETLAQAHTVIGIIKFLKERDWPGAELELQRSIELNPNYSRPYQARAEMLSVRGQDDAALSELRRALEIDPLSLPHNAVLALCLYYARRTEQSINQAMKTLELDPGFYYGWWALGVAFAQTGDFAKAITNLGKAVELTDQNPMMLGMLGAIYAAGGDSDAARHVLRRLRELSGQRYVSPAVLAPLHAQLGDRAAAFECLEQGIAEHSPRVLWLNVEPLYDPLHDDPRFKDLVSRLGLEN